MSRQHPAPRPKDSLPADFPWWSFQIRTAEDARESYRAHLAELAWRIKEEMPFPVIQGEMAVVELRWRKLQELRQQEKGA